MKDLSLYIHIPFCKNICHYCNFATFANKSRWIPQYVEKLIQEIEAESPHYKDHLIETIYFGGGTPSLIEAELIEKILVAIKKNFTVTKNLEICIECNPESVDLPKLQQYQKMGITRISLGIQSFNQKTLLKVARPHDHLTIFKALEAIQQSGAKNFSADFIMGLPFQTLETFKQELEKILEYNPPHLSCYFLSYDTNRIDIFKADCPGEEEQIAMYEHLTKRLQQAGFIHYEVSNFAKPGFECRHNQRYWAQKDYLGLGLGAHSIVNNQMWENTSNFEEYLQGPFKKMNEMAIDSELKKMEYLMLHMRTKEGIDKQEYQQKFGDLLKLQEKAASLIESGHIMESTTHLRSSEKGFLIMDKMVKDLI